MEPMGNDRWRGVFVVDEVREYRYRVCAWVDPFLTWRRDFLRKGEAGQDVALDLADGVAMVARAAERANGADRRALAAWARRLRTGGSRARRSPAALDPSLEELMVRWGDPPHVVSSEPEIRVSVERPKARYSTWYEMFPRSASPERNRPGTLHDVEVRLPYVSGMGFDVLYLPPIHPIGERHRKGRNGAVAAEPGDPGSPWAIGSRAGGHTAVDPSLGTIEDFDRLVAAARNHGVEIALDLAFQCSPDHPWVNEHPEWFRRRADGSIRHAENPPKKYEDIVPFDFESDAWPELWQALCRVVTFWTERGVRIFRVDNPHTKPFGFWEWLIAETRRREPDVLFLSEAFTRPKIMHRLAKLGFSQSYTYFSWRNEAADLRQYFEELTGTEASEYFRPTAWPNTPDILTEYLQHGGRPAFVIRLLLAGTLAASYGIYGPPFELLESTPRHRGSEEYLDSEKYQQRTWDLERDDTLRPVISRLNRIRRDNPALQQDRTLKFHHVDNPALIAYSKVAGAVHSPPTPERGNFSGASHLLAAGPEPAASHVVAESGASRLAKGERPGASQLAATSPLGEAGLDAGPNVIVCVVNTNPYAVESGTVRLDLEALGIGDEPYQLHDLFSGARYSRRGPDFHVVLDPGVMPAHVLRVRRRVRAEQDFEYYL